MLTVLGLVFIGVVSAEHLLQQCNNATVSGRCPTSFQSLHYFCNATTLGQARQLCTDNNLQLAIINDDNSGAALQTQQWCALVEGAVWIESYNGLSGGPCMAQFWPGFAGSLAAGNCTQQELPVLCQEIPRQISTLTSTISKTIWTGASVEYVTVTPTVCKHGKHKSNLPEPKVLLQDAIVENFVPPSRPCANTCSTKNSRFLRLSLEKVPYSMALSACKRHGWQLADFTTGMSEQVAALLEECGGSKGWVRSIEGIDGAACLFVNVTNSAPLGFFGYSPNSCDNNIGPQYPICDIRCSPARTGLGPVQGTTTSFTSVTRTTLLTSVPLSIETVTVTQWPKHDPKNPRCCCRACQL